MAVTPQAVLPTIIQDIDPDVPGSGTDFTAASVMDDFYELRDTINVHLHDEYALLTDSRFTNQRVPTDLSVTNAKVANAAAIAYTKLALTGAIQVADLAFDPATQAELDGRVPALVAGKRFLVVDNGGVPQWVDRINAPVYIGSATLADFQASPTQHQVVQYFGQGGQVTGLLPQASLTRATWFDTTVDDSMQGNASQSLFTNLGTPKTALKPLVGDEADGLVQAGNKCLGYGARVIGHIASCEAQGSGTEIDFAFARDHAAKSARDVGTIVRQHAQIHAEDQSVGISGKLGAAWSILVPLNVHTFDSISIAKYTGVEGHLVAASSIGAASVTLETGHGAGGFRGSSPFAGGQVCQVDIGTKAEVRTISTVVGDVITFTTTLSKAHAQYCRVAVVDGNSHGMWYMASGNIKTDSVIVGQSFQGLQVVVTAGNGVGFYQMQAQTGGSVGTPSAATSRLYQNGQKVLCFKHEDGIEAPVSTTHRIVSAVSITLTALQSGICAITDTSAARTVTLPAANAVPAGWWVQVKDESGAAATNNITLTRAGADDIEGVATKVVNTNYGHLTVYSNGSNRWFIR